MAEYVRQTAKKCRIKHLLNGNYVQKDGWDPNYFETEVGEISRVNIMAIVVGNENNTLTVDDGSGKITVRSFGEVPLKFEVGDVINVIGRPRIYNNETYITVEIVKKIDSKWLEHRKVEVELLPKVTVRKVTVNVTETKIEKAMQTEVIQEVKIELKTADSILEKIRELDNGSGVEVEKVLEGLEGGDKLLRSLLEEGELFEVRPGMVKLLD